MSNIIKIDFEGRGMAFTEDGWFNATVAANRFGKRPVDWLRLPDTAEYLSAYARRLGKGGNLTQFNEIKGIASSSAAAKARLLRIAKATGMVRTRAGASEAGGGTWLHPKLAVAFARWLDADFAAWCDEQIDELLRTGQRQAMTVWQELQALQLEDAGSFARASFGSHLMLERKRALPGYRERRERLEHQFAPRLPLAS